MVRIRVRVVIDRPSKLALRLERVVLMKRVCHGCNIVKETAALFIPGRRAAFSGEPNNENLKYECTQRGVQGLLFFIPKLGKSRVLMIASTALRLFGAGKVRVADFLAMTVRYDSFVRDFARFRKAEILRLQEARGCDP